MDELKLFQASNVRCSLLVQDLGIVKDVRQRFLAPCIHYTGSVYTIPGARDFPIALLVRKQFRHCRVRRSSIAMAIQSASFCFEGEKQS